ncbi:MAG: serine/threonine protein kinase [Candidatus Aramenus sulfurataquae]|uniref:non-specific serine/threonine protein kinase n=2 Tax=Candidatus Aramenus sulfurataquae TaxID=1326980 RepID=W7KZP9_9CREN|nr:MAG: serine/threonine protein kinase [Candidatus Aramenus sulfurataquae]MCL7343447.1 Kae1-associated kinase Bud32 [Candidatus Aramenus sulfurataquae]
MEGLRLIKRGAESVIYEGYFLGIHAIFKKRVSKSYRDPKLDKEINEQRTMYEARTIYSVLKAGINAPAVLFVDLANFTIVMEFVEGAVVREYIDGRKFDEKGLRELGEKIGHVAGKLHKAGIAHGDLTTNNLILKDNGELFVIDFGLSKRTNDVEDFATDVHVLLRSLESVHPEAKDPLFEGFISGYSIEIPNYKEVIDTVREIRMRGRYVEERRSKASDK